MRLLLLTGLLFGMTANAAFADRACRSVYVNIQNRIDRVIRVVAFWYYDTTQEKWRYEDIPNVVMGPGSSTGGPWMGVTRQTLEKVREEAVTGFSVVYFRCSDPSAQNQSCPVFESVSRTSAVVPGDPAMTSCRRKDRLRIVAME